MAGRKGARRWLHFVRPSCLLLMLPAFCWAQQDPSGCPQQFEGDWNLPDFTFQSVETLAPLRLHYITFGSPARDAACRAKQPTVGLSAHRRRTEGPRPGGFGDDG